MKFLILIITLLSIAYSNTFNKRLISWTMYKMKVFLIQQETRWSINIKAPWWVVDKVPISDSVRMFFHQVILWWKLIVIDSSYSNSKINQYFHYKATCLHIDNNKNLIKIITKWIIKNKMSKLTTKAISQTNNVSDQFRVFGVSAGTRMGYWAVRDEAWLDDLRSRTGCQYCRHR